MAKGSHGGKGSKPRPIQDKEAFDRNWDRIFGGDAYSQAFDETDAEFRARIKADLDSRSENESQDTRVHASPESGLVERMDDASR